MACTRRLRAGGREHCAKQKAFGTVLATAPSPAFYRAAKKPLGHMGGFFAALKKRERREVEGRGIIKAIKGIALVGAKKVSPLRRAI